MRANEFVTEAELEEGVKDWVKKGIASATLGAAALGGGQADAAPQTTQQAKPAMVQPAAAKNDHYQEYNLLSNNTHNELIVQKVAKAAGLKGTELAQFLAQVKHESWDFNRLAEKPQPGVKNYFSKKYDPKYAPSTAKILGNKNVGDGAKYHGRGYIQLTGRDNYRMAGDALKLPLLQQPEMASNPEVAAKIAVWYWNSRVKPFVTNFKDTSQVTKKINPALKGLKDRQENYLDYAKFV